GEAQHLALADRDAEVPADLLGQSRAGGSGEDERSLDVVRVHLPGTSRRAAAPPPGTVAGRRTPTAPSIGPGRQPAAHSLRRPGASGGPGSRSSAGRTGSGLPRRRAAELLGG